ncbi:MAG: hypothetical protein ACXWBN_04400 [Acidimicrobiales bacterium]
MGDKWRRKNPTEPKAEDSVEAVWGDDEAGATEHPDESEPVVDDAGAGAEASAEASTRPTDEFDVLGAEVAEVLRHTSEVADRVRSEAEEQARATLAEAEQQAHATVAEAERQASDQRAEAEREIDQQRAEVSRQLDEAARVLEAAEARDRAMRREAEQHLADALAARDSGGAILERASGQLARAEAVAQVLATQIEAARREVGPITTELQALAEQLSSVVRDERSATVPHRGTGDDPPVIDLRDSSGSPPHEVPVEPSSHESPSDQDAPGGGDSPAADAEPTTPTEAAEQL